MSGVIEKSLSEVTQKVRDMAGSIAKIGDLETRTAKMEAARAELESKLQAVQQDLRRRNVDLSGTGDREVASKFRPGNLLAFLQNPNSQKLRELAAYELDICQNTYRANEEEIFRRQMSLGDARTAQRTMSTLSDSSGGVFIPDQLATMVFPGFYKNTVLAQLGATFIDPTGWPFRINVVNTLSTAGHRAEGAAPTASDLAFRQVSLRPRWCSALCIVTNQQIKYSSVSTDSLIVQDMERQVNVEMDRGCLVGDDTDNEPLGFFPQAAYTDLTINGALTLDILEQMRAKVDNADAMIPGGKFGYLFHPLAYSRLKRERIAQYSTDTLGAYVFPMMSDAKVLEAVGYPIQRTTNIPTNVGSGTQSYGAFGNWADQVVTRFGGLEVKRSTEATVGGVNLFEKDCSAFMVTVGYDTTTVRGASFCGADDINVS